MTLKVNGYQWGWTYSYPDFGDFEFSANMLPEEETTPELYRFATDNNVVVPVGQTIRVTTTARDVIHSWAMPNFAIKVDAVPGRINETWFKADREGMFYGQCSEICGVKHSFMPIAVEVVSMEKFQEWVDGQREAFGMEKMFDGAPAVSAAVETIEAPAVLEVADASSKIANDAMEGAGSMVDQLAEKAAVAVTTVSAEVLETINRCQTELDAVLASGTINFSSGRAEIDSSSRALLDDLTTVANGCSGVRIAVAGHTDSTGNEESNVSLSEARAQARRQLPSGRRVSTKRNFSGGIWFS